ncbi:MAG: BACON domain-containing carbohydrate-binding protein, partial [Candidatus Sumerlaeia bacterium]|nr:BACON domain-containing carbohydrate-binding protein [Candidatus Sumerlaeia bacterium]
QGLTEWINPSATSGTGSGQVSISFEPNALPQQRSATITIAGTSFLYTQFAGEPQTEGEFFLFY